MLVQTYANAHTCPPGHPTLRYTVHPEVMVGGELNDSRDLASLVVLGVGAVLNVGGRPERELFRMMPHVWLVEVPLVDDGVGFARDQVRKALSWALTLRDCGILYVHCHIGVSRSPAIAYGILRWCYGYTSEGALQALNESGGPFGGDWIGYAPKHAVYRESVEAALAG